MRRWCGGTNRRSAVSTSTSPSTHDAVLPGTQQAGDGVEHARLARARGTDERGQPVAAAERHVERMRPSGWRTVRSQHHAPRARRCALRASASDATSAPNESATESATSRIAAASPPGACVSE